MLLNFREIQLRAGRWHRFMALSSEILSAKLFWLAILLICPSLSFAQYTTGLVQGSILDPSAAPLKGASVELTSLETGDTRTFPTNADGLYSFTAVPPGKYRLHVSASGFTSPLGQHYCLYQPNHYAELHPSDRASIHYHQCPGRCCATPRCL
jgi:hypothetical protein